ncbi:unnamed protein product [Cuscuta campestris]|uniref:Uncharacterized protein n=1 Tax=Cuscuta campestris TaxID=132261 RepID=A0A484N7Z8_9ASTE|nr:unnamed protein product [Cuscuta campestris]
MVTSSGPCSEQPTPGSKTHLPVLLPSTILHRLFLIGDATPAPGSSRFRPEAELQKPVAAGSPQPPVRHLFRV